MPSLRTGHVTVLPGAVWIMAKLTCPLCYPLEKKKCSSSASPASLVRRDRLRNALQSRWLMCITTRRYELAQWSLIQEHGQPRQLATQLTRCVGSGSPSRRLRCCVRIRAAQTRLPRREIGSWTAFSQNPTMRLCVSIVL